jgi:hypothetical protein
MTSTAPKRVSTTRVPRTSRAYDALGTEQDGVMGHEGYLLDNQQPEAGQRFDALSQLFDPVTFRHLAVVGVSAGWACWLVP